MRKRAKGREIYNYNIYGWLSLSVVARANRKCNCAQVSDRKCKKAVGSGVQMAGAGIQRRAEFRGFGLKNRGIKFGESLVETGVHIGKVKTAH
jgi:hypothetical protein